MKKVLKQRVLKQRVLKQRDFAKVASFRGELNLRTRSESFDEKNFKYSRKQKHKHQKLEF